MARIRQTLELPDGLSIRQTLRHANALMGIPHDEAAPLPDAAARLLQALFSEA